MSFYGSFKVGEYLHPYSFLQDVFLFGDSSLPKAIDNALVIFADETLDLVIVKQSFVHTYRMPNNLGQPWVASYTSGSRSDTLLNNRGTDFRIEARVDLIRAMQSPIAAQFVRFALLLCLPLLSLGYHQPFVEVSAMEGTVTFQLLGASLSSEAQWALPTSEEMCGPYYEGGCTPPPNITLDATTGLVTWHTQGNPQV
jgi:hypothetical protein